MRLLRLTDANSGRVERPVLVRADCVVATAMAHSDPDRPAVSTLVYTTGGNCLPVKETPEQVWDGVWDVVPEVELSAAERAAADSLPADFVAHLFAGDRATFNPDGTFKEWVKATGG